MSDEDLTRRVGGQLLVATPLTGDYFRRAVILVLQHDDEGAHGLMLNKPMSAPVSAVLPEWQGHTSEPQGLFSGGPVGTDTAMGLISVPAVDELSGDAPLGTSMLFGGLGLVDLDTPPPVVLPELAALRIFVGYAGWTANQLDEELVHGAWYIADLEARDPFDDDPDTLWRRVLARQRTTVALVSTHTDHPDRN